MNRLFLLALLFVVACAPNTDDSNATSNAAASTTEEVKKATSAETFNKLSEEERVQMSTDFLAKKDKYKQESQRVNLKMRLFLYSKSGRVADILFKQENGDFTKKNDFVGASKLVNAAKGEYHCEGDYYLLIDKKKTKKKYSIDYVYNGQYKDLSAQINVD